MSPSDIGFLALGLALGLAAAAVVLAVAQPRSLLRPVVKVTVTPNAISPREPIAIRPSPTRRLSEPARGSPDEHAQFDVEDGGPIPVLTARAAGSTTGDRRTLVLSAPQTPAPVPAVSAATGMPPAVVERVSDASLLAGGGTATAVLEAPATAVPEAPFATAPVEAPDTALPSRIDVGTAYETLAVRPRPPVPQVEPVLAEDFVAIPIVAGRSSGGASAKSKGARASSALTAAPCDAERTATTAACSAAESEREQARAAADRLREAQRARADLEISVEDARALADPRRQAAEKERLHAQFKVAHSAAASADAAEAAAREWLTAVSEVNTAARDAARRALAGTEELRLRAASLEALDLEASAARIAAERAEDACRAAREALAACEELQRAATQAPREEPSTRDASWPGGPAPDLEPREAGPVDLDRLPVVLRILRGDPAARERMVASLAADDPAETAAWHVLIARFVDAVNARAIEDGYLDLAEGDPFWRLFSDEEQREIVLALSSLGFRFDGMRGFADDRVPSTRDLSLAVGYAGLDRMRIRSWPSESGMAALFEGAVVRADLWLAHQSDDLTLARVEAALGPRATGLNELWDAWGRVRPALLEEV